MLGGSFTVSLIERLLLIMFFCKYLTLFWKLLDKLLFLFLGRKLRYKEVVIGFDLYRLVGLYGLVLCYILRLFVFYLGVIFVERLEGSGFSF